MAVVEYFLRDTQTNEGTGGSGYDLLPTTGTGTTLNTGNLNSTVFTEMLFWQVTVNDTPTVSTFPVSIIVGTFVGTLEYRARIQRVNSSNTVLASSAYTITGSSDDVGTGSKNATFNLSQTWEPGDRFRLSFEIARTAGHGNVSMTVQVNETSFVDIDTTEDLKKTGNFFLMF